MSSGELEGVLRGPGSFWVYLFGFRFLGFRGFAVQGLHVWFRVEGCGLARFLGLLVGVGGEQRLRRRLEALRQGSRITGSGCIGLWCYGAIGLWGYRVVP